MRRRADAVGSLSLLAAFVCLCILLVLPPRDRPAVYNQHIEAARWLSLIFFVVAGWAMNRRRE
jgi:hypothetical protein